MGRHYVLRFTFYASPSAQDPRKPEGELTVRGEPGSGGDARPNNQFELGPAILEIWKFPEPKTVWEAVIEISGVTKEEPEQEDGGQNTHADGCISEQVHIRSVKPKM